MIIFWYRQNYGRNMTTMWQEQKHGFQTRPQKSPESCMTIYFFDHAGTCMKRFFFEKRLFLKKRFCFRTCTKPFLRREINRWDPRKSLSNGYQTGQIHEVHTNPDQIYNPPKNSQTRPLLLRSYRGGPGWWRAVGRGGRGWDPAERASRRLPSPPRWVTRRNTWRGVAKKRENIERGNKNVVLKLFLIVTFKYKTVSDTEKC